MNIYHLIANEIPEGYITGLSREPDAFERLVAHLYKGEFGDPGAPMCKRGWNRDGGTAYSIWRNNVGVKGICKVCMRRAFLGKEPIGTTEDDEEAKVMEEKYWVQCW